VAKSAEEQEWRGLIDRLHDGKVPQSSVEGPAPMFDDASARNRVGTVITRAVLGEQRYDLYRLYCGEPPLPR
jgi:hypothetical protein